MTTEQHKQAIESELRITKAEARSITAEYELLHTMMEELKAVPESQRHSIWASRFNIFSRRADKADVRYHKLRRRLEKARALIDKLRESETGAGAKADEYADQLRAVVVDGSHRIAKASE